MLRLAWSNLTSANRRLIAPVLAVALGVGFVAATFIAMATMSSSIVRVVADDLRGYDVVVTPNGPGADGRGGDLLTPAQLAAMSSTPMSAVGSRWGTPSITSVYLRERT